MNYSQQELEAMESLINTRRARNAAHKKWEKLSPEKRKEHSQMMNEARKAKKELTKLARQGNVNS